LPGLAGLATLACMEFISTSGNEEPIGNQGYIKDAYKLSFK